MQQKDQVGVLPASAVANGIMIAKCFEMAMIASLPSFHQAYISSQCVGLSEPISQAAKFNGQTLIMTEINFLAMTP